ncbi:hypothetical protein A4X06_0g4192 [Tilletia controversa]|uniref:Wax synthase domain-containing protein n=1 Tax=Tilletia controversa TaxID=13291 RepID=A0A8X7MSP5_9BASI|nr:hypothetical protein A4X06_0g4192 [Tilletia controversa]
MDALTSQLAAVFQWAYPSPSERAYLDLPNLGLFFLPMLLHTISIHLLLRHSTRPFANALRTGVLLPLNVVFSIRAGLGCILRPVVMGPNPAGKGAASYLMYTTGGEVTEGGFQHFHVAMGVYSAYSILRALEWGLAREPPRLSKDVLDLLREEKHTTEKGTTTTTGGKGGEKSVEIAPSFLPTFVPGTYRLLELDLLSNMRGIGWEWGIPHTPDHPPTLHPTPGSPEAAALQNRRATLLRSRFKNALIFFLLADVVDSILKERAIFGPRANVGGLLRLGGAANESMRYEEQHPALLSWILTLLAGLIIPISMNGTFYLFSALALLPAHLFPDSEMVWKWTGGDPAGWAPALFGSPHAPRDLRTLWGRDWHALFRRPFLVIAYQPVNEALKAIGLGVPSSSTQENAKTKGNGNGNGKQITNGGKNVQHKSHEGFWRGTPGKILRRALSVLSVFVVSGLMHEAGQLAMARTPAERDSRRFFGRGEPIVVFQPPGASGIAVEVAYVDRGGRAVLFFLMQGVGCVFEDGVERAFVALRGKGRGGGLLVRLVTWAWVAGWIFGWGHYVGKTWFRMGIAQGVISFRATSALAHMIVNAFSRA